VTSRQTKLFLILALVSFAWVSNAHAKRKAPKTVTPIDHSGVTYVVKHWGNESGLKQNGGYLEAQDPRTGEKLWGLTVYIIDYVAGLEGDIQDVFITSMRVDKARNLLIVENAKKQIYWVDPVKRTATHVIRSSRGRSK